MDGLKTAMRIKEKYPKLPVVLVTAYMNYARVIDIAYLYQHSFRNILSVPLHLEHILMEYHINRIGHWSNQYSGH
ncbi:hypothetical protein [Butyribacter intestini]